MILKNYPKLKFWLKRLIEICTVYRIRYHVPLWSKKIALFTFDDGPIPQTLQILDMLDRYNIKAVFFVVAEQVKIYPEIAREILKRRHEIGLHCLNHVNMKELALAKFSRQVKEGLRIVEEICGVKIKYFRPPFGQINVFQAIWALARGLILVFWSCTVSSEGEIECMDKKFPPIILLHDQKLLKAIEVGLKNFDNK